MSDKIFNVSNIKKDNIVSKVRKGRDNIISPTIADELNTYKSFSPFVVFNDMFENKFKLDASGKYKEDFENEDGPNSLGVRSIFNKYAAVMLGAGISSTDQLFNDSSSIRISNNVPLMDSPNARKRILQNSGCSVKELVEASEKGSLGAETYSYSDFMYCKYLGQVPNNQMITLRRFPLPVDDFISTVGENDIRYDKSMRTHNTNSIGCMVTWLGVSSNDINSILSYTYKMPFKESSASWQTSQIDADSNKSPINAISSFFDPMYRKQYMAGEAGNAVNDYINKGYGAVSKIGIGGLHMPNGSVGNPMYTASEWNNFMDENKVYGPVDSIKSTMMRDSSGLSFDQGFTLNFEYQLKAYNGINGRQAMLDLLSNILAVTYTTGTFWGGGVKGGGAHQNNIFTNMNLYKTSGGFTSFIDAGIKDASNIGNSIKDAIKANGGLMNTLKNMANQLGGMLISGKLNELGRPQKQQLMSMLSPAPVGFWHVTVGNPHHPIMSIGNMVIDNVNVTHHGPLGIDDFPTELKVAVTLKRGKPRDSRDIEKLYMHGNDRIFYGVGPKVYDMYKHSKDYKSNSNTDNKATHYSSEEEDAFINKQTQVIENGGTKTTIDISNVSKNDLDGIKGVMQKYFGNTELYSIYVPSMEQEYGSSMTKGAGKSGRLTTDQ